MIKDKKPEKVILDFSYLQEQKPIQNRIEETGTVCVSTINCFYEEVEVEQVLYVTDDPIKAKKLKAIDAAVLIYLHEGNREQSFSGSRYFIEGFDDVDATYFKRIYQREKKIPWTIGETDNLYVREMRIEDTDALYSLYKDKSVVEFIEDLPGNKEEEREYIAEYIDKVYGFQEFGMWLVLKKDTGEIIGRVGFQNSEMPDTAELGFLIIPAYQRKGYAFEACKIAISYMKETFPEIHIKAKCRKENAAAIALCQKLCMELEMI